VVTVTKDAEHQAQRLEKEAQDQAGWLAQHVTQDPQLQQEWIRQDNLAYGGLIAIGIVLVQPFVGGASPGHRRNDLRGRLRDSDPTPGRPGAGQPPGNVPAP
jgi:hypothetical protein